MRIYLLLLFVLMVTRTQATNVIFDRITMDSGLSSSSVTSILKDRTGYVWVGTTEAELTTMDIRLKYSCPYRIARKVYKAVLSINYSRIQMEVSGSFFLGWD